VWVVGKYDLRVRDHMPFGGTGVVFAVPCPLTPGEVCTATHCNTLQEHTAAHWHTLQHTATHCNTLQHIVIHCRTGVVFAMPCPLTPGQVHTATHCNSTLQHTATHCNTLQHTATHCNTLQHTATAHCTTLPHTATHCNTLQHTATHCNTLQHTAGLGLCLQCLAL